MEIPQGILEGFNSIVSDGSKVSVFRNVPFGKEPNRWMPPEMAEGWDGVRNATAHGPACYQNRGSNSSFAQVYWQSDDCLNANIYAPEVESNKRESFPVMIFYHGGGYKDDWGGNPFYHGDELPRYGVVYVAGNYRLGRLGFMSTEDEAAPGNYGMLDQVLLMRWVKENIEHFNGDPTRVTIFGESAGGASVSTHMLSPKASGLFHRAIGESGSAVSVWGVQPDPRKYALRLAEGLGCDSNPNNLEETIAMVDCMKSKPTMEVLRASMNTGDSAEAFAPCVDGFLGGDSYLPDFPRNLYNSGEYNHVPYIVGVNKDEGSFLMSAYAGISTGDITWETFRSKVIPTMIRKGGFEDPSGALYDMMLMEYTHWKDPYRRIGAFDSANRMLSDAGHKAAAELEGRSHAKNGIPSWIYHLNFATDRSPVGPLVIHGAELLYIFNIPYKPEFTVCINEEVCITPGWWLFNERDREFSTFMATLWTNFAKYGDPTPGDGVLMSNGEKFKWEQVTEEDVYFAALDEVSISEKPFVQRAAKFWNCQIFTMDEKANWPLLEKKPSNSLPLGDNWPEDCQYNPRENHHKSSASSSFNGLQNKAFESLDIETLIYERTYENLTPEKIFSNKDSDEEIAHH